MNRRISASLAALLALAVVAACSSGKSTPANGGSGSTSGASAGGSTLTVGLQGPFTGPAAIGGTTLIHGTQIALADINKDGGVLGHQLQYATSDDALDAVDVVPSLRRLLTKNPVFVTGPFSSESVPAIPIFDASQVVNFTMGANVEWDNQIFPYVYRTVPSDSNQGTAMAIAAKNMGLTRAAVIFDNSTDGQTEASVIKTAFKKLGGTIVSNETLTPDQPSYRTEVLNAFNANPQFVFFALDSASSATLFADARQLGHLNVPYITDSSAGPVHEEKTFGQPAASHFFYTVEPHPASSPAYDHFLAGAKALNLQVDTVAAEIYDATVIGALAMIDANSTDGKVWVKKIADVSDLPGTKCYTFSTCKQLLLAHQKINYEGAANSDDFNANHSVFGDFGVGIFKADTPTFTSTIPAADIAAATG